LTTYVGARFANGLFDLCVLVSLGNLPILTTQLGARLGNGVM